MPGATQQELRNRLRVFKDVGAAESLADISVRMKDIWQTHDSFYVNGCNPAYSMAVMRREGPTAVRVMCEAASRCLTLLGQQGITEDGSFIMPQDAATVTCMRMLLYMLARFVSDWIFNLDDKQAIAKDSGIVGDAVKDTGLLPLVSKACSLLAHSMQQQQQGQQHLQGNDQEHSKRQAMPPITLACEILNTWQVLANSITHTPQGLSLLSHELTTPSIGPAAELALTILTCWDGTEPCSSLFQRGVVNAAGVMGKDTNMPIEECWRGAVKAAASAGDWLASAWHDESWAVEQHRNSHGLRDASPPEGREAKALEVLSSAEVNQLMLLHLGLVAQTMKHQLHDDGDDDGDDEDTDADTTSCSNSNSGCTPSHHHQQQQREGYIRLFEGLAMPALAAYGQSVVNYDLLGSPQVATALKAASQSCFIRSQEVAVPACAATSSDRQNVDKGAPERLDYSAMAAEVHLPVAEVVLSLIKHTRPQRGKNGLEILTCGLDLLSLVLTDWLSLLHRQQEQQQQQQQQQQQGQAVGIAYPGAAARGSVSSGTAASSNVSGPRLLLRPLLTILGPTCRQAEAEHPFNNNWLIPMPWDQLLAAEEAGKLLPKFGGLLRDLLLSMRPEECASQLAAVCKQDPVTAAETLEWVLRNCFRVTVGTLSTRSYHGKAEGTCESELTPDLSSSMVCKAAEQHYTAAVDTAAEVGSSAADVPAAVAVPAGLSECLADDLGSLVLLCYQVVHGVTAAHWYQQQQQEGHETAACLTAGKHQAALLNSCLKLLNRLAVKAGHRSNGTLTAAGRWWAVKTAAAISVFGVSLANSVSANSSSTADGDGTTGARASSGNSGSKDGNGSQFAVVGWSMAARSWLLVSQLLVEASGCKGLQHQELKELLGSVRGMSGVLDGDLLHNNKSLPQLQEQCHIMITQLDELLQGMVAKDTGCPQQQLVQMADDLQVFGNNLAAQLPSPYCCNNTGCMTLTDCSELLVCRAKCTACKRAYFCSKECQAKYWKQHKEACKALAA